MNNVFVMVWRQPGEAFSDIQFPKRIEMILEFSLRDINMVRSSVARQIKYPAVEFFGRR